MNEMPNRSQRRAMMKNLGLLKKKSNLPFPTKWLENVNRGIQTGKEIHRRKAEDLLRSAESQLESMSNLKKINDETPYKWSRKNPR
jgi:hypothetical protein